MGWKTINGRRYYYNSEREGLRVKTTYFGAGESGLLMSLSRVRIGRSERPSERKGGPRAGETRRRNGPFRMAR